VSPHLADVTPLEREDRCVYAIQKIHVVSEFVMCAASLPAVTTVLRSDVCSTRTSTIADADICEQSSSSGERQLTAKPRQLHRQPVAAQRMLCCFLISYVQEQYVGRMLEKKKGNLWTNYGVGFWLW